MRLSAPWGRCRHCRSSIELRGVWSAGALSLACMLCGCGALPLTGHGGLCRHSGRGLPSVPSGGAAAPPSSSPRLFGAPRLRLGLRGERFSGALPPSALLRSVAPPLLFFRLTLPSVALAPTAAVSFFLNFLEPFFSSATVFQKIKKKINARTSRKRHTTFSTSQPRFFIGLRPQLS